MRSLKQQIQHELKGLEDYNRPPRRRKRRAPRTTKHYKSSLSESETEGKPCPAKRRKTTSARNTAQHRRSTRGHHNESSAVRKRSVRRKDFAFLEEESGSAKRRDTSDDSCGTTDHSEGSDLEEEILRNCRPLKRQRKRERPKATNCSDSSDSSLERNSRSAKGRREASSDDTSLDSRRVESRTDTCISSQGTVEEHSPVRRLRKKRVSSTDSTAGLRYRGRLGRDNFDGSSESFLEYYEEHNLQTEETNPSDRNQRYDSDFTFKQKRYKLFDGLTGDPGLEEEEFIPPVLWSWFEEHDWLEWVSDEKNTPVENGNSRTQYFPGALDNYIVDTRPEDRPRPQAGQRPRSKNFKMAPTVRNTSPLPNTI